MPSSTASDRTRRLQRAWYVPLDPDAGFAEFERQLAALLARATTAPEVPGGTNDEQTAIADERAAVADDRAATLAADEQTAVATDEQAAVLGADEQAAVLAADERAAVLAADERAGYDTEAGPSRAPLSLAPSLPEGSSSSEGSSVQGASSEGTSSQVPSRQGPVETPVETPSVPDRPDPQPVGDLRAAVTAVRAALDEVGRIVADRGVSSGGELAGLAELLDTLDRGHAIAIELVDRIETDRLAQRKTGLPLESLLAMSTNTTFGDRRFLLTARDVLGHMPYVRQAFDAGLLGWGQVRAIVAEARPLTVALRTELDQGFADTGALARLQPDEIVDRVAVAAAGLRDGLERRRAVARQQRRYLHVQESFEGGVKGNFDLPAEDGALLLEALHAAAAAPTGDRDITADALDPTTPTDPAIPGSADPTIAASGPATPAIPGSAGSGPGGPGGPTVSGPVDPAGPGPAGSDATVSGPVGPTGLAGSAGSGATGVCGPTGGPDTTASGPTGGPDTTAPGPTPGPTGIPGVGGPVGCGGELAQDRFDRPRARQFADALVRLAEAFLAGARADGNTVRARPTMTVVTDVADLVGDTEPARRARLLWRLPGAPPALTREAVRRLSCDADLQLLLVDGHHILGISAPTSYIPTRLRRAVAARDQGCRFPGCRAPVGWTDLHHVIPRERDGPTAIDNLVAICRRHHMAITEGRWRLTMTPDGVVTVRRGRQVATSDPPLRPHPIDG